MRLPVSVSWSLVRDWWRTYRISTLLRAKRSANTMDSVADRTKKTKKTKKSRQSTTQPHPLSEKLKKAMKAERHQLLAIDEATASDPHVQIHERDAAIETLTPLGSRKAFTQEHIVHLFDGDLNEFAPFASGSDTSSDNNNKYGGDPQSHRQRVQYVVENEVSGDFFRIRNQQRRQLSDGSGSGYGHARTRSEAQPNATASAGISFGLRDLETTVVVMCQGILTGLCWMDAFNLSSSDASACAYSAVADRSRQLFFVLFKYPL